MSKRKNIPMPVIRRLPKYRRYLLELSESDTEKISSTELGIKMGLTPSQIRQDFNCFGDFGQQGYGYNVEVLLSTISEILGMKMKYKFIIIGIGNIGQAIAKYTRFEGIGFELKGIFDINPSLIGLKFRNIEVYDVKFIEEFVKEKNIDIACICIDKRGAQQVCDKLVSSGIKAIWNFAPIDLNVPKDVPLENVHLSESILTLGYLLNEKNK